MKIRLSVSLTALALTFIVSIYSNVFFTSFKRSVIAFILFYILATIVEKILEPEIKRFQETSDTSNTEKIENEENDSDNGSQEAVDFQPLNVELLKNKSKANVEIEDMDPEMIARLLNNLDDDDNK